MNSPVGHHGLSAASRGIPGATEPVKAPKARLLGQVFTPDAVADLIAALTIERADSTVFDPCVGEGALVLAAGRRLASLGAAAWHFRVAGLELDPEAWAEGRRRIAEAAGVAPDQVPVRVGDFLALPAPRGESGQQALELEASQGQALPQVLAREYDAAVMNPPYTRQERLAVEHKAGVNRETGLSRRAGLHAHFWIHLARFVRQGGRLGAITSATWLDAAFGRNLREFLLREFRIHFLIQFERDLFPDAEVEACVAILERRSGPREAASRAGTPVRFVRLCSGTDLVRAAARAGALAVDGEGPGFRARVVTQGTLSAEERWGRFFLDAGTDRVVQAITAGTASAPVVPLQSLARIRRGITTGNNRVFLLSPERAAALAIEERFLRPILRSPREVAGLDTASVLEPTFLLLPPGPEDSGTRAAAYLGSMGIWECGSVGDSDSQLPTPPSPHPHTPTPPYPRAAAPLLFGYAVRARKAFLRNSAGILAGDNFFEITPARAEDLSVLFALLNAVPTALLLEVQGRGQGRGLLKIQRYELAALPVPAPSRLDPGLRRDLEALGEALRRAPGDVATRRDLDHAAARAFGQDAATLRSIERDLAEARRARQFCHGIRRKDTEGG